MHARAQIIPMCVCACVFTCACVCVCVGAHRATCVNVLVLSLLSLFYYFLGNGEENAKSAFFLAMTIGRARQAAGEAA